MDVEDIDASLEKIVHAGEQDLEPVHRHIGKAAANVFDTQVAGGFLGYGTPSLVSILSDRRMVLPELADEPVAYAAPGFCVIATANLRDRGVSEMSAAFCGMSRS